MTEGYNASQNTSERQRKLFQATLRQVSKLGYKGDLLQKDYSFGDWFEPGTPLRQVAAAAFGRTPVAYDSACLALLLANGKSGQDLVLDCRALGAPIAFEIREDCIIQWKVGRNWASTEQRLRIFPDALERVFEDNHSSWHSSAVLRAKNTAFDLGPRQLDLIDLGLIPALESHIKGKLDRLLREILDGAIRIHQDITGQKPDFGLLFRLVFRMLAAKVLHDRRISGFAELPEPAQANLALRRVAKYYNDPSLLLQDESIQSFVAERLWNQADFQNLSVEVLAYIYENTLVDESVRQRLGTHSTPYSVARYILHRLPIEEVPLAERRIIEPFCGHAIFLVSALQRLRDLLPPEIDHMERHRYFVSMLEGFEIDAFALEVAKMCLMLADFPNHNGWKLHNEDVFSSKKFTAALQRARVVVCNPPFEDFGPDDRTSYPNLRSVKKPVEILHRVLSGTPNNVMFGFVLPRSFLDGAGYRELRRSLAERYCDMEVVLLPDRIFKHSNAESALLIGKRSSDSAVSRARVTLTEVQDSDREKFLTAFSFSRRDAELLTAERAAESLAVTALREVWDRLIETPRLGDNARIHRGVEWKAPFDAKRYLASTPRPGFKEGISSAAGRFYSFLEPPTEYLCTKPECRKGNAFNLPWDRPKVVMNAVRVSRGPWCIAAFADESGHLFSQSFTCLWPTEGWSVGTLAAVLNGPVANAFIATHESKMHVRKKTLKGVPLPRLGSLDIEAIRRLVDEFADLFRGGYFQPVSTKERHAERAREILIKIDAQVLRGYNLQPRLERQLLDFFRGKVRPVPCEFGDYYPSDFSPTLPLWMYISQDLANCKAQRFSQMAPEILDSSLVAALEEVE